MDYEFLDDTYSVLKDTSPNEEEDWGMEENEVFLVKLELFHSFSVRFGMITTDFLIMPTPIQNQGIYQYILGHHAIIFHLCCSATR